MTEADRSQTASVCTHLLIHAAALPASVPQPASRILSRDSWCSTSQGLLRARPSPPSPALLDRFLPPGGWCQQWSRLPPPAARKSTNAPRATDGCRTGKGQKWFWLPGLGPLTLANLRACPLAALAGPSWLERFQGGRPSPYRSIFSFLQPWWWAGDPLPRWSPLIGKSTKPLVSHRRRPGPRPHPRCSAAGCVSQSGPPPPGLAMSSVKKHGATACPAPPSQLEASVQVWSTHYEGHKSSQQHQR